MAASQPSADATAAPAPGARKIALLDAAAAIVAREGAAHLTLDRVAVEAGLSKGGVLYHFPSKRALLDGMLAKLMAEMEARAASYRDQGELIARLKAERDQTPLERSTALALLANAAEDPSLLEPARVMVKDTLEAVAGESADPELAQILFLAQEGIRFLTMLDLLPHTEQEQDKLRERMQNLARSTFT